MSDSILSEEEIDALLHGVSKGDVATSSMKSNEPVSRFDFTQQHNIVISGLPKLETISNQFIKGMRKRLLTVYKKDIDVQLAYLHTKTFSEYQASLPNPSNLNLITISPFNQSGLITFDSKLLFILVDQYFGGTGKLAGRVENKSFSPIELKMSEQFIELIIDEWRRAWEKSAVMLLTVNGREDNPAVLQVMGVNDVIFQLVVQVGFNGNFGEFQVVIPYAILESLRQKLGPETSPKQGSEDDQWRESLSKEIAAVQVEISSSIDNLSITLQELIELSPGDVVPIEMPESICLYVEGLPMFEGRLGASNGKNAIEIERNYSHTRPVKRTTRYLHRV